MPSSEKPSWGAQMLSLFIFKLGFSLTVVRHALYTVSCRKTESRKAELGVPNVELQLSQHYIDNACYKLHFGVHNDEGVHGGCPVEMLHCLNLGIFKYVPDCFFDQIGKTSKAVDTINGLAV